MDEQTNPAAEPTTTTLDPVVVDTPTTEPPQAEPTQVPVETVFTIPATPQTEPVSEQTETLPETSTAQMGRNEPLPEVTPEPAPQPSSVPAQVQTPPPQNIVGLILTKARAVIQLRKQKKLIKIMNLFAKQTSITNDEVEKLLHVSDATATRYLSELEKQGKITQTGKTGKSVSYIKSF